MILLIPSRNHLKFNAQYIFLLYTLYIFYNDLLLWSARLQFQLAIIQRLELNLTGSKTKKNHSFQSLFSLLLKKITVTKYQGIEISFTRFFRFYYLAKMARKKKKCFLNTYYICQALNQVPCPYSSYSYKWKMNVILGHEKFKF